MLMRPIVVQTRIAELATQMHQQTMDRVAESIMPRYFQAARPSLLGARRMLPCPTLLGQRVSLRRP
jgi:hypothetical protein